MIIKQLNLTNYRNIKSTKLELSNNINVFQGDNAQGKTNVVESIAYLSLLKSFRKTENKNLVKDEEEFSIIEAINEDNKRFKCVISKDKRQCFINDVKIKRFSEFIGKINVVVFSPENVSLFKDSPGERREYLDDEISKLFPSYFININEYKNIKKERNELLKQTNIDRTLLDTYTVQLADLSFLILNKRKEFIDKINEQIGNFYKVLTGSNNELTISYQSDFIDTSSKEEILDILNKNINDDINRQQTLLGIHKDDLIMYLDKKPISEFGSQAQNRLAVVSLKLSTLKIIKEIIGEDGIVVLDDVLSELDKNKQERLLSELNISNQIFITTATPLDANNENINKYVVESGEIRRI